MRVAIMSMDPERLRLVREMVSEGVLDDHVETLAEVLADRDDLAREVELRGQDIAQWQLACARHQREHFDAKAEAERLRGELGTALRDLAIVYGRNECGQRFPGQDMLRASARRVAARNGWPDPYPEADATEGASAFVGTWPGDESEAELLAAARVAGGTDAPEGEQP